MSPISFIECKIVSINEDVLAEYILNTQKAHEYFHLL